MKKNIKTPFAAAMGVAFISSFAATAANAEANPFGMSELSQGYMQLAEAKAGEMACGANMSQPKMPEGACAGKKTEAKPADAKAAEASCGAMMKGKEGACGAMMKGKEGACGAMMKMPEGKCGAQCGENMKQCESAKAKEGACGANMKGCGEGMAGCAEMSKGKEGACAANKGDAAKNPPPVVIHAPEAK